MFINVGYHVFLADDNLLTLATHMDNMYLLITSHAYNTACASGLISLPFAVSFTAASTGI